MRGDEEYVKGIPEMQYNFMKCIQDTDAIADKGVFEGGRVVQRATRHKVPVRTGRMARGVQVTREENPSQHEYAVSVTYEGVPYADWVEIGGSRGRPHVEWGRYLIPALRENIAEIAVGIVKKGVHEVIRRYSW